MHSWPWNCDGLRVFLPHWAEMGEGYCAYKIFSPRKRLCSWKRQISFVIVGLYTEFYLLGLLGINNSKKNWRRKAGVWAEYVHMTLSFFYLLFHVLLLWSVYISKYHRLYAESICLLNIIHQELKVFFLAQNTLLRTGRFWDIHSYLLRV